MKVKVQKYKGDRRAAKGIERMARRGWTVQSQSTRKAVFSLATGLFTRKQIHTVTFVKGSAAKVDLPGGVDDRVG